MRDVPGTSVRQLRGAAFPDGQVLLGVRSSDWINLGIPQSLWHLPLYATECNGNYYWKGGHPECTDINNPSCSYQPGWIQEIYAEINRWNTIDAPAAGKPRFRCINMYRWCNNCDGWNIDGSPVKGQMLADRLVEDAHSRAHNIESKIGELRSYRREVRAELMRLVELVQGLVRDDQRAEREERPTSQLALLRRRKVAENSA